jgi:hypothetical protein
MPSSTPKWLSWLSDQPQRPLSTDVSRVCNQEVRLQSPLDSISQNVIYQDHRRTIRARAGTESLAVRWPGRAGYGVTVAVKICEFGPLTALPS